MLRDLADRSFSRRMVLSASFLPFSSWGKGVTGHQNFKAQLKAISRYENKELISVTLILSGKWVKMSTQNILIQAPLQAVMEQD